MTRTVASLALLLRDDFSGAVVGGAGVDFFLGGRRVRPLRKEDGCFVFTDLPEAPPDLTVCGAHYQPRRVEAKRFQPVRAGPQAVRLWRDGTGPFRDCRWLRGVCGPGLLLRAVWEEELFLQTAGVSGGEGWLVLQGRAASRLAGRRLFVGGEACRVRGRSPNGVWMLEHPLRGEHRAPEPVRLVYGGCSGPDGHYAVPVDAGLEGGLRLEYAEKEGGPWRPLYAAAPS